MLLTDLLRYCGIKSRLHSGDKFYSYECVTDVDYLGKGDKRIIEFTAMVNLDTQVVYCVYFHDDDWILEAVRLMLVNRKIPIRLQLRKAKRGKTVHELKIADITVESWLRALNAYSECLDDYDDNLISDYLDRYEDFPEYYI